MALKHEINVYLSNMRDRNYVSIGAAVAWWRHLKTLYRFPTILDSL